MNLSKPKFGYWPDKNMFASRAGDKLNHGLQEFGVDVAGKVCADLGCSTGGFTSCLLEHGSVKVYAVDTGYGVLDWKLRQDPRVVVMERTNALHVQLPEKVDFVSVDVSWTPQHLILPHALTLLKPEGIIISLIKPHYEAPKQWLRKGMLLPEHREETLHLVTARLEAAGITPGPIILSPVVGEKGGNVEYLMCIRVPSSL